MSEQLQIGRGEKRARGRRVRLAAGADRVAGRRVDLLSVFSDRDVNMRELRQSRSADFADVVALLHDGAGADRNASLLQVTILDLETVAVIDDEAVAAFLRGDRFPVVVVQDEAIRLAVAQAKHLAVGHGENRHAALDVGQRQDAQIRSIVSVIGRAAAERIDGIGAGVHVRKLLHETIAAERAVGGQAKLGGNSVERARKQRKQSE